ncbi:hypothetical protein BgiBS90_000962, partial [Biomphalaria glabrata]
MKPQKDESSYKRSMSPKTIYKIQQRKSALGALELSRLDLNMAAFSEIRLASQ